MTFHMICPHQESQAKGGHYGSHTRERLMWGKGWLVPMLVHPWRVKRRALDGVQVWAAALVGT
jgi:hypothetical protein